MSTRIVSPSDNAPELADLTTEERTSLQAARDGLDALKKTFDHWVMIGHGLRTLRDRAGWMSSRFAFDRMRNQAGLGVLNKATVSLLLKIVDNLPEVVKWRETLSSNQRFEWASPSAINKHCPLFKSTAAKPQRAAPAMPQELGPSAAGAVNLARQLQDTRRELEAAQAHIEELEAASRPKMSEEEYDRQRAEITAKYGEPSVEEDEEEYEPTINFPEIPDNPDDPNSYWRWTDADEPNVPAILGVLDLFRLQFEPGLSDPKPYTMRATSDSYRTRCYDRLSFSVKGKTDRGPHFPVHDRLLTDWLSPEILAIWNRTGEVTLEFELSVIVNKKDFRAMAKTLERQKDEED